MLTTVRQWSSPGPVALAAWATWERAVILNGPIGSGKTGTMISKALRGLQLQKPWGDGVRRARLCVLRDDYRRLWGNFLPSWWQWIPKELRDDKGRDVITWTGSKESPAIQTIRQAFRDPLDRSKWAIGELDVHFYALGDNQTYDALEAFFAGLEFTWFWLNEIQTFRRIVFEFCVQRAGRYPPEREAMPVGAGVWGDCNKPAEGHWLHEMVTDNTLLAMRNWFEQPGGLDPDAENKIGHPRHKYEAMLPFMRKVEVDRKIHNRFTAKQDGEPVFDFDDSKFVADADLMPVRGRKLLVAMDAGLSPAALIGQRMADGQLRVLDEIVMPHGVGPERFGRALAALLDSSKYIAFRGQGQIRAVADPASAGGVDSDAGERDWMARVGAEAMLSVQPARTNKWQPRRQAVEDVLKVDGTTPRFLLSPTCVVARRALNGGYRWRKVLFAGEERYSEEPDKNDFSHVADALQYLAMEEGGYEQAVGREPNDYNAVAALMAEHGLGGARRASARERLGLSSGGRSGGAAIILD